MRRSYLSIAAIAALVASAAAFAVLGKWLPAVMDGAVAIACFIAAFYDEEGRDR